MRKVFRLAVALLLTAAAHSCTNDAPPLATNVTQRDSLPVMTTYGVSKLISDSGVIRYRIVAEEWKVYDKTNPPKQTFMKGIFMERLDPKFQVDFTLTADTAYWYNQNFWELHGRIHIRKADGTRFYTEQLFWDMTQHKIFNHQYMRITTNTQQLIGVGFVSDENLTNYVFDNSSGYFPKPDDQPADTAGQSTESGQPSADNPVNQPASATNGTQAPAPSAHAKSHAPANLHK